MSEQKVALVTGALGGIGSEICRQLVTAGYKIIATVVPREEERKKQWLQSEGIQDSDVRFVLTDLNNHEAATAAIQEAIAAEGRVDVLVNNAGITRDATFKKMSYEQWSQVIDTNLKTLFTVTQPVFNKMLEQKSGRIVNKRSVWTSPLLCEQSRHYRFYKSLSSRRCTFKYLCKRGCAWLYRNTNGYCHA